MVEHILHSRSPSDGRGWRTVRLGRHQLRLRQLRPDLTPDGKKILFASNKVACDSRNFELYLIGVDGKGLQQVTNLGFTCFPEFSPDGEMLVFCSDREAKGEYGFNIFTAHWTR